MEIVKDKQCPDIAKILVPWAGKNYKYCPVHANNIALLAQFVGGKFNPSLLKERNYCQCEGLNDLTDEMRLHNINFKPGKV